MSGINRKLTIDHRTYAMQSCLVSTLDRFSKKSTASSDTGHKIYSVLMASDEGETHALTFQWAPSVDDDNFSKTLDVIGQSDIVIDTKEKTFYAAPAEGQALGKLSYIDLEAV